MLAAENALELALHQRKRTVLRIDGGGGTSTGGDFSLTGTTGQADAGQHSSSGGKFSLAGGFWTGAGIEELIFKDSFEGD